MRSSKNKPDQKSKSVVTTGGNLNTDDTSNSDQEGLADFSKSGLYYSQFSKIADSSLDVFCAVDANGYFLSVSAASEAVWGYKPSEMIGRQIMDFVYPEDREMTMREAASVMSGNDRTVFENRYVKKDGSLVHIHWSARWDEKDQVRYGVARDATARKASEAALIESEKKYKNIFENNPLPMFIWDFETLRIIDSNREAELKYGYTREEFLQLTIKDVRPEEDIHLIEAAIKTEDLYGEVHKKVWRHKKKNGEIMMMDISGHLINYNGRRSSLVMINDITEKLKAEAQKKFEKINKEALINSTEDLIWSVSSEFKLLAANSAFLNTLRHRYGFIFKAGHDMLDPTAFSREDIAFWKTFYQRVLSGQSFKKEVYSPAQLEEKESWADISFNPIYQDKKVIGIACYSRNITENKIAEEKIRLNEARLTEAQAVAKMGSWETDLLSLQVNWSAQTYQIFEIDPAGYEINHPDFMNFVHPEDRNKVNEAFDSSFHSDTVHMIEHRIITPGGIEKTVEESWRVYFNMEGQPVRAIGTCQDITERKKSELALQQAYDEKNMVLESIDDGFFAIDNNSLVNYWNKKAEQLLGVKREDILNKNLHEVFTGGASNIFYQNYQKALGEKITVRFEGFSNLTNKWFAVSAFPADNGLSVYFKDVTEQKMADEQVRQSEIRYRSLIEQATDAICIADNSLKIIDINPKGCELLGFSKQEFLQLSIYDIFYLEELNTNPFRIEDLRAGNVVQNERKLKRKNGTVVDVEVSGKMVEDGRFIFFTRDITERKQAELKLRESNERFNLISKATNDMVWDWDLATGKVYRNPEGWKKIFRSQLDNTATESIDDWDNRIHEEDIEKVRAVMLDIKKSEKDFYEVECRIRRDDGSYAFIHDKGFIMRNEQGKALRILGATQDISSRKEAELQVVKSELRYRSLVQNSSDLVSILDEKAYYLYSSPAVKKILGYDPEHMVGKNAFSFIHPDDIVTIKHHFNNRKEHSYLELTPYRYRNAAGEWRWLESKITDMRSNPEVQGYVFNSRDVTERKLAEEEIEKLSIIARETVNAVVITDPQEKIVWVNEAFTQITEYTAEEVIGQKPGDFLQGKDSSPAVTRFMRQKLKNLEPFECDVVNYSKFGRKYWLRIQCQPQFDENGKLKYFFAIETDITKEKEAAVILKASEERYRYLFNNNPASIFIWDIHSLQILEVNNTALKEYGYTRNEFLSKTIMDHGIPKYNDQLLEFVEEVRSTGDFRGVNTSKHLTKKGEIMYLSISSHRIQYKGADAILALGTNITEKIYLERTLEKEKLAKQKQITEAVISAQEQERSEIGRELHDNINQILASSRLYLGLVKTSAPEALPFLEETDNLINSAISEIRNLSHSMVSPSLNESELIEALKHLLSQIGRPAGLSIKLDTGNFDENKITDKLKLSIYRIVQEQLNNILKYAKAETVWVKLCQDNNKIILRIKDDGIGFNTAKKAGGVGLMNMKTRASLFNGDLEVVSSPGKGCELIISFNNEAETNKD